VLSTAHEEWSYNDTDSQVSDLSLQSISPSEEKKAGERFFCIGYPPCELNYTSKRLLFRHIRYVKDYLYNQY
jgi:hypothetical protein